MLFIFLDKKVEGRYERDKEDQTKMVEKRFVWITLYDFDNVVDVFWSDVTKSFPDLQYDFKIFSSLGMEIDEDELSLFLINGEKLYVSTEQFDPAEYLKFYKLQKIG